MIDQILLLDSNKTKPQVVLQAFL